MLELPLPAITRSAKPSNDSGICIRVKFGEGIAGTVAQTGERSGEDADLRLMSCISTHTAYTICTAKQRQVYLVQHPQGITSALRSWPIPLPTYNSSPRQDESSLILQDLIGREVYTMLYTLDW